MPKFLIEACYTTEGTQGLVRVLHTPEEMDKAGKKAVEYRAPGR